MIYAITVIIIFLALLVIKKYRNKYAWTFALQFAGIALTCLALLCYVSKLAYYPTNFNIERNFLISLYKLRLNYYNISRIFNVATALFMYSMAVFSCVYGNYEKRTVFYVVLVAIPILTYIWLNDPETTYMMYLAFYNAEKISPIYKFLAWIFPAFNMIILVVYMMLPLIKCIQVYRQIKISYNKKQVILLSIIFGMIDVFYIGFFVVGAFKNLSNFSRDFLKSATTYAENIGFYTYFMPVIILVVMVIFTVLVFKFNVVYTNEVVQANEVKRRIRSISKDLYGVLHSYKNTLFSVVISAKNGMKLADDENMKKSFVQIEKTAGDSMKNLAKMLDVFNNVKINCEQISIIDCIQEAVARLPKNNNITVNTEIKADHDRCVLFIDKYYMTEAFYNLLINSVEAINAKDISDGRIDIEIYHEAGWLSIDIKDNGCGISRKNMKKIFKPLNSTKNTKNNWGVGLAYVHNVVHAHMGVISVKSSEGNYTVFEIILPIPEKETDIYL